MSKNKHLSQNNTGWGSYQDDNYTTGSPFTLTTGDGQVVLPNFTQNIVETQKPSDIPFYFYSLKANVSGVSGTFVLGETITGGTSGATATMSGDAELGGITGREGDAISITLEFKIRPTSAASNVRIQTVIDIGGAVGEIYPRDFVLSKGNGIEHFYLSSFTAYTLDTWEANNGIIKIQAYNSDVEIYNIRVVIASMHRNH